MPSSAAVSTSADVVQRRLPSGRSLVLRAGGSGEEIEIRSANGELDLRITLTPAGPVVSLRGARLEVASPHVAFKCRTFDVDAAESVRLSSDGQARIEADELRVQTQHDVHLNGEFIRLNCVPDAEPPPQND